MKLSGWGRYPIIDTELTAIRDTRQLQSALQAESSCLPRGLGRSYGDSCLHSQVLDVSPLDQFISFDEISGELHCHAGTSFAEILRLFVPRGWFLPVTPGTQHVTVGGAIASDVHGKNHHLDGSFSDQLIELTLMLASGETITCSSQQHRELFLATCSGMGLTGVIISARFKLLKVPSAYINETTFKTANLQETLAKFEAHEDATYSVAWIDCLAKGDNLGRSLVMLGEHALTESVLKQGKELFEIGKPSKLNIPFDLPSITLNSLSIKAFNELYYQRIRSPESHRLVHYAPYFYPLDGIQHWNRMYGKNGFVQYQFVIPKAAGHEGLQKVLRAISDAKKGSFLAVLKVFGQGNDNYLSFPEEGYTLALDFKLESDTLAFLDKLDQIVLAHGGKIYLTKDARMSETTFKRSYPQWQEFQAVREQYGALDKFVSHQAQRLGLNGCD